VAVTWENEVTNPFEVISNLGVSMMSLFFEYVLPDATVNLAELSKSSRWFDHLTRVAELQKVCSPCNQRTAIILVTDVRVVFAR